MLVVTETAAPATKRLERRGIGVVTRIGFTPDGRSLGLFSGPTGDLVPFERGAPRAGLVRGFLAGEPLVTATLAVCP